MYVDVHGWPFKVAFGHLHREGDDDLPMWVVHDPLVMEMAMKNRDVQVITWCRIQKLEARSEIADFDPGYRTEHVDPAAVYAQGVACCYGTDQFYKATGRKLALSRALVDAQFSKAERTEVWRQYWATQGRSWGQARSQGRV